MTDSEEPRAAPPGDPPRGFLGAALGLYTDHIAGKIVLPYLVLVVVLAVLASHITIDLVSSSLEDKYQEELAAAGRSANEAMVQIEDGQLAILRQMVFTDGVDEQIAVGNTDEVQDLLGPIAANDRVAYVDVFNASGREILALRSSEVGPDALTRIDPAANQWQPVRRVLDGYTDNIGENQAGIVAAPWGTLYVAAAPVRQGSALAGAIVVSMPLEEVTKRLSQNAGSKGITLYDLAGVPVASTFRAAPTTLAQALAPPQAELEAVRTADHVVVRRTTLDDQAYVEVLGLLDVRREPASFTSGTGNLISIIEERGAQTRQVMIVLFCAVLMVVLGTGVAMARRLTLPVYALVNASHRIRRNELDFEIPVSSGDEHGVLTAAFNEMTGGLRERERSRSAIERYLSPKVYHLIQRGELKMGGVSREITVFKTDIRDFTRLSEQLAPEALVDFLNRYFERMVAAVSRYDGEVDKYMGDAILAKFGATEWYPDHARRAVLAMIDMIDACDQLNAELRAEGVAPIRMGIGANTGEAVVGNIGAAERMEYTIISSAVNTAQRIEELCKELEWDLLISGQTYEQARDAVEVGRPWSVLLRGQMQHTLVYPILGRAGAVPAERREAYAILMQARSQPAALSESIAP